MVACARLSRHRSPRVTDAEVVAALKERLKRDDGWGAKTRLAKKIGVARSYLYDVLAGSRPPGARVLAYLGLQRTESITRRKKA